MSHGIAGRREVTSYTHVCVCREHTGSRESLEGRRGPVSSHAQPVTVTGGADAVFPWDLHGRRAGRCSRPRCGGRGRVFSENGSPSAVDLKGCAVCFWKYTYGTRKKSCKLRLSGLPGCEAHCCFPRSREPDPSPSLSVRARACSLEQSSAGPETAASVCISVTGTKAAVGAWCGAPCGRFGPRSLGNRRAALGAAVFLVDGWSFFLSKSNSGTSCQYFPHICLLVWLIVFIQGFLRFSSSVVRGVCLPCGVRRGRAGRELPRLQAEQTENLPSGPPVICPSPLPSPFACFSLCPSPVLPSAAWGRVSCHFMSPPEMSSLPRGVFETQGSGVRPQGERTGRGGTAPCSGSLCTPS